MNGAPIAALADVREFTLAGHARFTIVSKRTGQRRTFRVRRAPNPWAKISPRDFWFVDLLTGGDNSSDYTYLGFMRAVNDSSLVYSQNRKGWGVDAGGVVRWLTGYLNAVGDDVAQKRFAEECEFWHEGRCGRCGRALTDPESIRRGIGPVCDGKEE